MKKASVGITDPNQTALSNFELSYHYCEILTASILNREALNLRKNANEVRERREAGQEMRVDRKKGHLGSLKAFLDKKKKRNLEWSYEGGGCLTVLPQSQEGTDVSSN